MAVFTEPEKFSVLPGSAADTGKIQSEGSTLNPSLVNLFPAIYQLALAAGGKAPERTTFNALFKMIMERLYFIERGGVWSYDATADYPAGAVVGYSGSLYLALKDNGSGTDAGAVTPGKNTAVWQRLMLDQSLSNYVTLNGAQTISGAKTFTGDIIGINKNGSTEDANSLYSTTAGSKLTYYTISNNGTKLINVPGAVNTTLESRTIKRLSDSTWIVEQICHNSNGLYYRRGINGTWDAWKTFAFTDSDISGNAATATKLAAKRTIALSGAATGTATNFDGSDNITIPVTALASSAIRAQWYAAFPDGAEAHNAMWGGRDITAAFDSGEFSEHIADGTFKDIFPGDYITKQVTISGTTYNVNWVVADCDYWWHKGDNTAMETHHVVIVPQTPIFSANMNATNTTEGGYAGSRMYRETIPACATGIVSTFGSSHILTFRDLITRAVNTSSISSGAPFWTGASSDFGWYDAQCNLMCERMVYGMPVFSSSGQDAGAATRQFSAFRLSERLINYNREQWWLRDVASSVNFALVYGYGGAGSGIASGVIGVRPFALLC